MKIGISAPANYDKICEILHLDKKFFKDTIESAAKAVAKKHEIVIVPNKNSGSHQFAIAYKKAKGRKVIGIIPFDDKEFGHDYLDKEICDETVNAGTWRNVPECLDETSDCLLVLGWGPGIAVEVGQTKWFKVDKIFVVKELISGNRLAPELDQQLPIKYISADEVGKI
jgi:hypothetical protein